MERTFGDMFHLSIILLTYYFESNFQQNPQTLWSSGPEWLVEDECAWLINLIEKN